MFQKRSMLHAYILSIIILICTATVSIISIINPLGVYGAVDIANQMVPNDIMTLALAVPVLLFSMVLAFRKKAIGLLCWGGMLYYLVYNYIPYIFDVTLGVLMLPYLLLVALSATAMVMLVSAVQSGAFVDVFGSSVPTRFSGGVLIALAVFIVYHQSSDILSALAGEAGAPASTSALYFADFVLAVPLLVVAGLLVWQKKGLGYMLGGAMLFGYLVQCIGLIPFFFIKASMTGVPLDVGGVVAISAMVVVVAIPFAFFIRAGRVSLA